MDKRERDVCLVVVGLTLFCSSAWAALFGRDYVPSDHETHSHQVVENYPNYIKGTAPYDAILFAGKVHLIYQSRHDPDSADTAEEFEQFLYIGEYDLDDGTVDHANSTVTIRTGEDGEYDDDAIRGAAIALCAKQTAGSKTLTQVGSTEWWEMQHIGIVPPTISITSSSGGPLCAPILNTPIFNNFQQGYKDDVEGYKYDRVKIANSTGCTSISATYDYTQCSLSGTEAFRCPMDEDPDTDSDVEYGYCKFFMVYVGENWEPGNIETGTDYPWRRLMLAHSQELDSDWVKYDHPTNGNVLMTNVGPHPPFEEGDTANVDTGDYSYLGVPDLLWDEDDEVWRMWFTTETPSDVGLRYSESADDGLTWGFSSPSQPIDCYDVSAPGWDSDNCEAFEWDSSLEPPDNPGSPQTPDAIDPAFFPIDADDDGDDDLGMLFVGADRACDVDEFTDPENAVIMFAYNDHPDGEQIGPYDWSWESSVEVDTADGVVLDRNESMCETDDDLQTGQADVVNDPTIIKWAEDKYIMFYLTEDHAHVAGSGFECSNFQDDGDTADTDIDLIDLDCLSPTDDDESQ